MGGDDAYYNYLITELVNYLHPYEMRLSIKIHLLYIGIGRLTIPKCIEISRD